MSEKPSTPSSEQSDKSKKYDRQLRLWGDHGQAALESSHVCLINASATGTETLKSLVLPGVGAITIIDDAKVKIQDLGNNFFVERKNVGMYRGEVALHNLLELNPDVRGAFVDQPLEEILSNQPDFFTQFDVVIATFVPESTLLTLSDKLWETKIPLIVVRSYGMIGYLRIQVEELTIIESHPDDFPHDLRLDRPFPALQAFSDSVDWDGMSDKEHSHTPYALILLRFLKEWKDTHSELPLTYQQKKEFKKLVEKGRRPRTNPDHVEENFSEAIDAVNVSVRRTKIPDEVQIILFEAKNSTPCPSTKPFWVMAKALHEFTESEGGGALPISGVIPDMTSDTETFIKLQNLYRDQANADADWVYRRVLEITRQLGPRKMSISEADVKYFCKNSRFLRLVRGLPISKEFKEPINLGDLGNHLENPESELVWYVMLRAVDQFYSEFRAYPGFFKEQVETDIVRLKICVNRLLSEWGCGPCIKDDFIHEVCRYGAAEIHTVASYMGACAAQEVIKLLTGQYVPVDNTHIYNAISSTSATFKL